MLNGGPINKDSLLCLFLFPEIISFEFRTSSFLLKDQWHAY
jgi:hypothetical protein